MSARILIILVLLVLVTAAVTVLVHRLPKRAVAEIGQDLVAGVPPTPATVALLQRWRDRAWRWRTTVAIPTVATVVVVSATLRGSLDIGIGAHPAWADPLLMGLLSVLLGAIAAELHHLRRRPTGPRTAEMTPRDVATHLPDGSRRRLAVLVGIALVAMLLAMTVGGQDVPFLGLLALGVAGLVPVVQRGIVVRGRPAIASDLRAADDAVRRLAVRSVDEAGAGVVLLLAAWQLAPAYTAVEVPDAVSFAMIVGQLAALVIAILWWRRSNPRLLLPDVPSVLSATGTPV